LAEGRHRLYNCAQCAAHEIGVELLHKLSQEAKLPIVAALRRKKSVKDTERVKVFGRFGEFRESCKRAIQAPNRLRIGVSFAFFVKADRCPRQPNFVAELLPGDANQTTEAS
jgi:hypothetical protein